MSYKSTTHDVILDMHKKFGTDKTIEIAYKMLESHTHKSEGHFLSHVHGEICESVLEILIIDFINEFHLESKGWFYKTGLILKDVNNPGNGYFTELDLTVFSPQKIFAYECKSYGGDKKITDKCTIRKKKGGTFDVFDQHLKHFNVLADNLAPFRIANPKTAGKPSYQLALFDFALGETEDIREAKDKLLMPCLNETNATEIMKLAFDKPVMWSIKHVKSAVEIIAKNTEKNTAEHLKYVQALNEKRNKE